MELRRSECERCCCPHMRITSSSQILRLKNAAGCDGKKRRCGLFVGGSFRMQNVTPRSPSAALFWSCQRRCKRQLDVVLPNRVSNNTSHSATTSDSPASVGGGKIFLIADVIDTRQWKMCEQQEIGDMLHEQHSPNRRRH